METTAWPKELPQWPRTDFAAGMEAQRSSYLSMLKTMIAQRQERRAKAQMKVAALDAEIDGLRMLIERANARE